MSIWTIIIYRSHYKVHTEAITAQKTALVKIVNDLRSEVDNKKCVLLVLLDLSAAFDTVEQSTLLKRFETDFGIEGSVNQWLRSYFTGRSQSVNIQGTLSEPKGMKCGMPQGSIIGPKGYPPYVSPIFAIARASEISIHMYADDTQLYVSFSPEDFPAAQAKMERCIAQIRQRLSQNCLKLNDGNTELMVSTTQKDNIWHQYYHRWLRNLWKFICTQYWRSTRQWIKHGWADQEHL